MPLDQYRRANRDNWDARVPLHFGSEEYGISRYIDDPGHLSSVVTYDRDKMPPIVGKKVIHLQCHIGTDTISLARLGAEVTGIDLSPKSIEAARRLSADSGTPVRFVVSELYDTPSVIGETFDMVYTGVGALCWLPDIRGWASVVAELLRPGGVLYMREGHPMMWSMDYDRTDLIAVKYPYFETVEPWPEEEPETYAGVGVVTSPLNYGWNHGIGETINALIQAGLRIDRVEEHQECEWQGLEQMVLEEDGLWRLPSSPELLPVMWSVTATRSE